MASEVEAGILAKLDALSEGLTEVKVGIATIYARMDSQSCTADELKSRIMDIEECVRDHDKVISKLMGGLVLVSASVPVLVWIASGLFG